MSQRRLARPRVLLFLLVLTSLTLVTVDERANGGGVIGSIRGRAQDAFLPVRDGADAVFSPVGDLIGGIVHYDRVKKENARLRAQLQDARADQLKVGDAERRYKEALDLINLPFVGDIPTVGAEVVSAGVSNFENSIEINKGRLDGIAVRMPVVAAGGLVGRVVQVSERRATVLLVTDPESKVRVRLSGTGDQGTAQGTGEGNPLTLTDVDTGIKVDVGEALMTQRGRYPGDIPVGSVKTASVRAGALQQDITLVSSVDLRRLDLVKVLIWIEGAAP